MPKYKNRCVVVNIDQRTHFQRAKITSQEPVSGGGLGARPDRTGAAHAQLSRIANGAAAQRHRAPALSALPDPDDPGRHCPRPSGLRTPHVRVPQM